MATILYTRVPSPLGELLLCGDGRRLRGLYTAPRLSPARGAGWQRAVGAFTAAAVQLAEYFSGQRREFSLELDFDGAPPFHRRVWEALVEVPYGTTVTYGELAVRLGNPAAARAVGAANARNPIAIVVPCHRVVGSAGGLTGYAGGLDQKEYLLRHEGRERSPVTAAAGARRR